MGVATMPMFMFLAILGQFNWHCGTAHNQQQFGQHQGTFHFYSEKCCYDHHLCRGVLIRTEDGNKLLSFCLAPKIINHGTKTPFCQNSYK